MEIKKSGECFDDLVEWLEPKSSDGQPRAFKMRDREYFLSLCRPLAECILGLPENINSFVHISRKNVSPE